MTLDPRPACTHPARTLAAPAALLFLAMGLVACGPEPAEVDESPVAGMTEENPSDDGVLGEDIMPREGTEASLTLSGTPTVEGDAEVTCAVHEAPDVHDAGGHDIEDHDSKDPGNPAADDHGEYSAEAADDYTRVADYGADEGEHDEHPGDHGTGEDLEEGHTSGHMVLAKTATFALTPPGDAPLRLVVEIPDYQGEGEYEAILRLEAIAQGGSYAESTGTGTARVEKGTLLSSSAGTHWIGGTFEGTYSGAAGDGEASGSVERCYYFK